MSGNWVKSNEFELQQLIVFAIERCGTMRKAAVDAGMNFNTFRKYAKRFNVWKTNQGGQGLRKPSKSKIPLQEIIEGKHPSYGYGVLKMRLLASGIKKNKCENCGISEWMGKKLIIQLDHHNGDRYDHRLENLRMLCPNCHSQTSTYCGKNANVVKRHTHRT